MYVAGILTAETRVELVDGVLIAMNPPGPQHAYVVDWLIHHFARPAGGALRLRVQDTLLTPDGGFVLPDLFVCEPCPRDRLPDAALLVIEVAYSSRARDRQKVATYADIGVSDYWIVDIERGELVVHREPGDGGYADVERFVPGDVVSPLVDVAPVDVAALLGR